MKSPLRQLASELLSPAVKWLGLGAAIWASEGCLIPQDESYLSELPVPRNRPPRIVESQVQPSERIIRGYGSDLCELEFSVIVEDPDIGDTLSVHWFVDYDPNQPRGADSADRIDPNKGNDKAVRDERASFHPRFSSGDISRLNLPGDHVVELVVSDSGLVGREPEPRTIKLPDGRDFKDPGYTATYVWFVRTEATGGDCP